jgi:hypothetical protein
MASLRCILVRDAPTGQTIAGIQNPAHSGNTHIAIAAILVKA